MPQYFEAPEYLADSSFPDLEDTGIPIPIPQKIEIFEENIAVETDNQIEEQEKEEEVVEETMERALLHETVCEAVETNGKFIINFLAFSVFTSFFSNINEYMDVFR